MMQTIRMGRVLDEPDGDDADDDERGKMEFVFLVGGKKEKADVGTLSRVRSKIARN